MADQRQILTDKSVSRLPFAREKQYKVRDSELPGFFVLIGKRRKSFMAQCEFWRDGVREFTAQMKLGDFGEMTTREARGKAKETLGAIVRGQRPGRCPKDQTGFNNAPPSLGTLSRCAYEAQGSKPQHDRELPGSYGATVQGLA
jgi:hypothetical protein